MPFFAFCGIKALVILALLVPITSAAAAFENCEVSLRSLRFDARMASFRHMQCSINGPAFAKASVAPGCAGSAFVCWTYERCHSTKVEAVKMGAAVEEKSLQCQKLRMQTLKQDKDESFYISDTQNFSEKTADLIDKTSRGGKLSEEIIENNLELIGDINAKIYTELDEAISQLDQAPHNRSVAIGQNFNLHQSKTISAYNERWTAYISRSRKKLQKVYKTKQNRITTLRSAPVRNTRVIRRTKRDARGNETLRGIGDFLGSAFMFGLRFAGAAAGAYVDMHSHHSTDCRGDPSCGVQ